MDIEAILEENKQLKVLVEELQEKLKKYTNPVAHQVFYEKNKEKIIKESSERLKKLAESNPGKIKEYRRTAYLKRKDKLNCKLFKFIFFS
jgi:cell division septum initiation protein DivIVA